MFNLEKNGIRVSILVSACNWDLITSRYVCMLFNTTHLQDGQLVYVLILFWF